MRRNRILLGFSVSPFATPFETARPSPAQTPRIVHVNIPADAPPNRALTNIHPTH